MDLQAIRLSSLEEVRIFPLCSILLQYVPLKVTKFRVFNFNFARLFKARKSRKLSLVKIILIRQDLDYEYNFNTTKIVTEVCKIVVGSCLVAMFMFTTRIAEDLIDNINEFKRLWDQSLKRARDGAEEENLFRSQHYLPNLVLRLLSVQTN